ncbi:MAG: FIG00461353: hypothetical protein [uncultured Paraburkholderia sp.]|nr:MAG: FIG00461353: hypothetical protein [uncultured Paraburkholderia sp.]
MRDAAWADYARRPVSVRTAFRRWPKIRGSVGFMLRRDVRQKTALFCEAVRFLCCKPLTYISFFLLLVSR